MRMCKEVVFSRDKSWHYFLTCTCVTVLAQAGPSPWKKGAKIPEVLLFLAKKSTKQDGFGMGVGFVDWHIFLLIFFDGYMKLYVTNCHIKQSFYWWLDKRNWCIVGYKRNASWAVVGTFLLAHWNSSDRSTVNGLPWHLSRYSSHVCYNTGSTKGYLFVKHPFIYRSDHILHIILIVKTWW